MMTVAIAAINGEIVDTLDELATRANDNHQRGQQAERAALEFYIECGRSLIRAKEQLTRQHGSSHGHWLVWLKENFNGSQPTASRYMSLAENYSRVSSLPPDTSLREALEAIKQRPPAPNHPHTDPDEPNRQTNDELIDEKPWRFGKDEPDEQQKANWSTTFASFKAYTDVLAKGLNGESHAQMLSYLKSIVKEMENKNGNS